MGIEEPFDAFLFSLETMATIGYGTQDIFFNDCLITALVLTLQICSKLVIDGAVIGIIYARLSRPSKRASTIVFSNIAIIRRIRGRLYFMFQLCELRKHHLVEAHVRCYTIRHERDSSGKTCAPFQTCAMRLSHPNDETGGTLLMCLPQLIVHEIDCHSPLMPPPMWTSKSSQHHRWYPPAMQHACISPNSDLHAQRSFRQADDNPTEKQLFPSSFQDNKEYFNTRDSLPQDTVCSVDAYDSDILSVFPGVLKRSANDPLHSAFRMKSRLSPSMAPPHNPPPHPLDYPYNTTTLEEHEMEKEMIIRYFRDRRVEVISLVEGADSSTGAAMQARHSYTLADIRWDFAFEQCVFEDPLDYIAVVNFEAFHRVVPVAHDVSFVSDVSSMI